MQKIHPSNMYNPVAFNGCTELYNHDQCLTSQHFQVP